MSDEMMLGIAKMPYEMAMGDEMSRRQFYANTQRLAAALEAAREDVERLDWLDSMNAKLNSHYGTTYRWKLVLSPNVVRLMSGAGGNGHAAAIDLHDSEAHGTFTCREAIDRARKGEQ